MRRGGRGGDVQRWATAIDGGNMSPFIERFVVGQCRLSAFSCKRTSVLYGCTAVLFHRCG